MTDILREKYARLMAEVADLEERVEDLEKDEELFRESPNPEDVKINAQELRDLRELLAEKRNELARLSDGCGRPHPQ